MVQFLINLRDAAWFQNTITAVILLAGVVVGLETYPSIVETHYHFLRLANNLILLIFILEIAVKMGAEGNKPWKYFMDPWNVFDFLIVITCLMPFGGSSIAVLRLLRLLRVLKLVNALPKLQILVGALLKSIPSMFYVSIFLSLLFYIYACAAVFVFSANDPIHFQNLEMAMLTLFRIVTLEDWTDIMYISMYGCDNYGYDGNEALCVAPQAFGWISAAFFVSFVMMGTMVVLNLFIGVIMNGMEEAQKESEIQVAMAAEKAPTIKSEIAKMRIQFEELQKTLDLVVSMSVILEKDKKKTKE